MRNGMLYFNFDPNKTMAAALKDAVSYYNTKFALSPDLILVHPSAQQHAPIEIEGVTVRETNSVLPRHAWIGTEK